VRHHLLVQKQRRADRDVLVRSAQRQEGDSQVVVAEISKNWERPAPEVGGPLLCQLFEDLIEVNRQRGYELHSFQLHRLMYEQNVMNETIIAVFRKRPLSPAEEAFP
jgi:hypothetical protein